MQFTVLSNETLKTTSEKKTVFARYPTHRISDAEHGRPEHERPVALVPFHHVVVLFEDLPALTLPRDDVPPGPVGVRGGLGLGDAKAGPVL